MHSLHRFLVVDDFSVHHYCIGQNQLNSFFSKLSIGQTITVHYQQKQFYGKIEREWCTLSTIEYMKVEHGIVKV